MSKKFRSKSPQSHSENYWLYGFHSCDQALKNPERRIRQIIMTASAAKEWSQRTLPLSPTISDHISIERQLPTGAVHQGIAMEVEPLPEKSLEDYLPNRPLILLDHVTDPHNVGAIIRTAAAFNAGGVIMTDRHSPKENGTLAKAASGGLELIPLIRVTNLAHCLETLKRYGYWCIGLTGETTQTLSDLHSLPKNIALVLGAEGEGLRRLTAERCDILTRIPINAQMESLNVSNAAAIALYHLYRS